MRGGIERFAVTASSGSRRLRTKLFRQLGLGFLVAQRENLKKSRTPIPTKF